MAKILKKTNVKLGEGTLDKSAFNDFGNIRILKKIATSVTDAGGSIALGLSGTKYDVIGSRLISIDGVFDVRSRVSSPRIYNGNWIISFIKPSGSAATSEICSVEVFYIEKD